jgi:hypothetical protein
LLALAIDMLRAKGGGSGGGGGRRRARAPAARSLGFSLSSLCFGGSAAPEDDARGPVGSRVQAMLLVGERLLQGVARAQRERERERESQRALLSFKKNAGMAQGAVFPRLRAR